MRLLIALAAVCLSATPALARERSLWVRCDGLRKPESVGVTSAKIGAAVLTAGFSAFAEEEDGAPDPGKAGIDACTQALADPLLEPFWTRKINILWRRALLFEGAGDSAAAIADLDAAKAVTDAHPEATVFNRVFVSASQMFKAAMLVKAGKTEEAEALALESADARPYAMKVQELAAIIMAVDPSHSAAEDKIATRRLAMDPDSLSDRASSREWSDPEGAADDWEALVEAVRLLPRKELYIRETYTSTAGSAVRLPGALGKAALSAARVGRVEKARAMLAELDGLTPWTPETPAKNKRVIAEDEKITKQSAQALQKAAPYKRLTQAWLLVHENKVTEARALMTGNILIEPATLDLIRRLQLNPDSVSNLADQFRTRVKTERQSKINVERIGATLRMSGAPKNISLTSATGSNTFSRVKGYSEKKLADGAWRIDFKGNYGTAILEELSLLRAAQLARENGAKSFAVADRWDFAQYWVPSGQSFTPPPATYATTSSQIVFEIVVPDKNGAVPARYAARKAFLLDVDKVWGDLSPIYSPEPAERRP